MRNNSQNTYDAVIIGAGIGGLVCGCYLAKGGMKVLIAEQRNKPGGYCTSFKRKGFTFDAAAHSIGGLRYGIFGKIFEDFDLNKKIEIKKFDPPYIIVTPEHKIALWHNLDKTIQEFQKNFPTEGDSLKNFFYFLVAPELKSLIKMRSMTFKELLDKYFNNHKIKAIIGSLLIWNGGLPPSLISAFIGIKIFKEFILDGGYHCMGGMQSISDALAEKFVELGGDLMLSCFVKKIVIKDARAKGIITSQGDLILSKYIVSNCDAYQTFFKLIGKNHVNSEFKSKLKKMIPSLSAFVLYIGLKEGLKKLPMSGINMCFLYNYDLDKLYSYAKKGNYITMKEFLLYIYPDKKRILAFIISPFKNKKYWINNKEEIENLVIRRIEAEVIPNLSKYIKFKDSASPYTLYRYTLNYKGAAFGWACTPTQLADLDFRKPSFIHGLYLTGSWTTHGLGIPGVAYIGYDTAKIILRTRRENK